MFSKLNSRPIMLRKLAMNSFGKYVYLSGVHLHTLVYITNLVTNTLRIKIILSE
jgi:hypothetical protein